MIRSTGRATRTAAIGLLVALEGCQGGQVQSHVAEIPQITRLVEKATAPPRVHRFRRPLRDERRQVYRELAAQCERMIADLRSTVVSEEALSGLTPEDRDTVQGERQALESSLSSLGQAARSRDREAIRRAHQDALAAYRQSIQTISPHR